METVLLNTTASDFDCGLLPYTGVIAYSSQWSRPLLTLPHPKTTFLLVSSQLVHQSDAAANLTLLIALPGRQLGWAKNSHRSALPRIYIPVKVIQHSGCPVAFVKFMFSRPPSAAEPGKACQHSKAKHCVCSGISLEMQALLRLALKGWLRPAVFPWSLTALLTRDAGYLIRKVAQRG